MEMETERIFIVEYDLQGITPYQRVKFHRQLEKVLKIHNQEGHRSTQSVFVTESESLAWEIHDLAHKFGEAYIYQGRRLNGVHDIPLSKEE